jgi:hypothetical protein
MTYLKDPDATLDFGVDYSDWLDDGDAIDASTWTVQTGLTVGDDEIGDGFTVVWLSGGTAGESYLVTNHIETTEGRIDDRSFTVLCEQR